MKPKKRKVTHNLQLGPKSVLEADEMKINLNENGVEITLLGTEVSDIIVPFKSMSSLEAALLRLQYAKEVILPGQNTSSFFKKEEK